MKFRKPMLAKEYSQKRLRFPAFIQPKLDGIRCITDGKTFWSRNGKVFPAFNMGHLQRKASTILFDGELMIADRSKAKFEDLASIVKRNHHPQCREIEFRVFDIFTDQPFHERRARLEKIFQLEHNPVAWKFVPTVPITSVYDLHLWYGRYLLWGMEGAMIRTAAGLYVPKRTNDLLKYKPLKTDEFKIVGTKEAKGKDKRTPVFICATKRGSEAKTFNARPMGTMSQRKAMWYDRAQLIGKKLIVEYQYIMKSGRPRHPRAVVLRDYE